MVLGRPCPLALSRLIDNSVVVLENIFRHMEMGEPPVVAAERGGKERYSQQFSLQHLAPALSLPQSCCFYKGVSKYLFTALALAVVIALFSSYLVAMTVVPLFCAKFMEVDPGPYASPEGVRRLKKPLIIRVERRTFRVFKVVIDRFNLGFHKVQRKYEGGAPSRICC